MQILIFVAGCVLGVIAILIAVRGQLADLRKAVDEARDRENQENAKAAASAVEVTAALVEKASALKDAEAANRRADEMIAKEREAQQEIVKAKDEQIEKLNDFITQAKSVLTTEFKALSGDVLKDASGQMVLAANELIKKHGEKTTGDVELHKQQIAKMLGPVEQTIIRLDQQVADSNVARSKAEALLDEQINRLAGASESLSSALRKPVVRGSWGEMTLENALENAGLRAEVDFVLQHSTDGEDGRKRTDAIINLPKGRKLIIDSKNLMESYIAYSIAEDPAQKAVLQAAHARSLRGHIRDLSSKAYQERYDTPDCVILFIPHDGMYHAALQDEAELIREACERRVFVANPMSLIPLLKAVGYVLNQERANKSAEAIKNVGQDLYAQIARFAANMATIGIKLEASVKAYNDAIPGLDRYILSKARTLKQLGAGKGSEPELPEAVELEPRPFSSRELKTTNLFLQESEDKEELSLAASIESETEEQ
ncbi:MAG: DNA recombination protein RmuC [Acidobacteriaceae bacterium]|jgi:DNA recombination protein RmuC